MATKAVSDRSTLPVASTPALKENSPPEVWQIILGYFSPKESQAPRLVCRSWRLLTALNWKNFNRSDLKEFVQLLVKQVQFTESITPDLETLSFQTSALEASDDAVATPEQVDRAFWSDQGKILKIFNKLAPESRQNIALAIGHQIPHSLTDLFELSKVTLVDAVANANIRKFSIVLSQCTPLQNNDLSAAFMTSGSLGNLQMVHVLTNNAEIDPSTKARIAFHAFHNQHQACAKELLDKNTQYLVASLALSNERAELFRFVQSLCTFVEHERAVLVKLALEKNLFEEVKPLLNSPISDLDFVNFVDTAILFDNREALEFLLKQKTFSPDEHLDFVYTAYLENNLEITRLLLGRASVDSSELIAMAIIAIDENKIEFAHLYLSHCSVNMLTFAMLTFPIELIMNSSDLSFRSRLTLGILLIQHNLKQCLLLISTLLLAVFVIRAVIKLKERMPELTSQKDRT